MNREQLPDGCTITTKARCFIGSTFPESVWDGITPYRCFCPEPLIHTATGSMATEVIQSDVEQRSGDDISFHVAFATESAAAI
jgi:hypothetical protein